MAAWLLGDLSGVTDCELWENGRGMNEHTSTFLRIVLGGVLWLMWGIAGRVATLEAKVAKLVAKDEAENGSRGSSEGS